MENREYKICSRCVMDTTDPDIVFDGKGICNHCKNAEVLLKTAPYFLSSEQKKRSLSILVDQIKKKGKKNAYDCIIGLSGGVDSSYAAYKIKELGLRPLAIHLDNGWDSELSVKNIENICNKLEIDLYTMVLDWEEFKDLQLSFLKSSTPDSEIPSDNAIFGALYSLAAKNKIKYILLGYNKASESILPRAWSQGHFDTKYIKFIQKKFGTKKLKSFPLLSQFKMVFYTLFKGIQSVSFLDYLDYHKNEAKKFIMQELDWKDYGRKHCESHYTRIYQEYILPNKFKFDKRKAHYSSLIMAGQMTREEALKELKEPLYPSNEKLEEDIYYLSNKFGISRNDFDKIMNEKPKRYEDYPNFEKTWYYRLGKAIYFFFKGNK